MSKRKQFEEELKNNPALHFMTPPDDDGEEETAADPVGTASDPAEDPAGEEDNEDGGAAADLSTLHINNLEEQLNPGGTAAEGKPVGLDKELDGLNLNEYFKNHPQKAPADPDPAADKEESRPAVSPLSGNQARRIRPAEDPTPDDFEEPEPDFIDVPGTDLGDGDADPRGEAPEKGFYFSLDDAIQGNAADDGDDGEESARHNGRVPHYYRNPEYIEAKTKNLHLLIKPTTYNGLKDLATEYGISLNSLINIVLETIVKSEKALKK